MAKSISICIEYLKLVSHCSILFFFFFTARHIGLEGLVSTRVGPLRASSQMERWNVRVEKKITNRLLHIRRIYSLRSCLRGWLSLCVRFIAILLAESSSASEEEAGRAGPWADSLQSALPDRRIRSVRGRCHRGWRVLHFQPNENGSLGFLDAFATNEFNHRICWLQNAR